MSDEGHDYPEMIADLPLWAMLLAPSLSGSLPAAAKGLFPFFRKGERQFNISVLDSDGIGRWELALLNAGISAGRLIKFSPTEKGLTGALRLPPPPRGISFRLPGDSDPTEMVWTSPRCSVAIPPAAITKVFIEVDLANSPKLKQLDVEFEFLSLDRPKIEKVELELPVLMRLA